MTSHRKGSGWTDADDLLFPPAKTWWLIDLVLYTNTQTEEKDLLLLLLKKATSLSEVASFPKKVSRKFQVFKGSKQHVLSRNQTFAG